MTMKTMGFSSLSLVAVGFAVSVQGKIATVDLSLPPFFPSSLPCFSTVFRSSQSNAEYEQPQHQGGLTGMISRVVDKVTGHDRSDSGMSMMGMMPSGGFDSNFAREQHQAVYGGGMGRMVGFS